MDDAPIFPEDGPDGLILVSAADILPKSVSWLWPGWLARGAVHLVAGSPAAGKTTLCMSLASTVSVGGQWPDGAWMSKAGNTLVWTGEDAMDFTLVPRLHASGADCRRVFFCDSVKSGDEVVVFDPAHDLDLIESAAVRIGGVDLLIVDPLISCVTGDMNANNQVRRALQPLVDLANRLHCVVIGITHLSKGTAGRDPLERVNGSIAFGALVRGAFYCAELPKDDPGNSGGDRIFTKVKSSLACNEGAFRYAVTETTLENFPSIKTSFVQWGPAESGTAREILSRAESFELDAVGRVKPQDEWLLEFLSHGPKASEVVFTEGEGAGFSKDQLRRARERLNVKSERQHFGGPYLWTLPAGTFKADLPMRGMDGRMAESGVTQKNAATHANLGDDTEVF